MGLVLAGAGDGQPHLVVALVLPVVLAVLLVVAALGLVECLVLNPAHCDVLCPAVRLLVHTLDNYPRSCGSEAQTSGDEKVGEVQHFVRIFAICWRNSKIYLAFILSYP